MEEQYFNEIRDRLCLRDPQIKKGKMMSSEAIMYKKKVFTFFSGKKKMVFKLGNDFDKDQFGIEINVFNPFNNRAPMKGWFEVPYSEKEQWEPLAEKALKQMKQL